MRTPVSSLALVTCLTAATAVLTAGQTAVRSVDDHLKRLFPTATTFSAKEGHPPHYTASARDTASGQPSIVGYAFWTTDLEPLERGYDGPIQMLVGLDPRGMLAGVIVAAHYEPYGYFSVEPPEFGAQFVGKDIRDPFVVGQDVDAVARATITITSATRAIRNSARRFARQYLTPPSR